MATKLTQKDFTERIRSLHGDKIKSISKFKSSKDRGLFLCSDCGSIWGTKNSHVIHDPTGCPVCKPISRGEQLISDWLEEIGIPFQREYSFPDLKHHGLLRFDFAVFNYDGVLTSLIEYDGKQHFKSILYWGGDKAFELRQKRDDLKTDYCNEHDIKLIRIPYTEINNLDYYLTIGDGAIYV